MISEFVMKTSSLLIHMGIALVFIAWLIILRDAGHEFVTNVFVTVAICMFGIQLAMWVTN